MIDDIIERLQLIPMKDTSIEESEISVEEKNLLSILPTTYGDLLSAFNGQAVTSGSELITKSTDNTEFGVVVFYGIKNNSYGLLENKIKNQDSLPYDIIPFGELDGGDLLCINIKTKHIYCWIHDLRYPTEFYFLAKDMSEFLSKIEISKSKITETGCIDIQLDF